MADAKTEQEPSIEEILESIRQIISDDSEQPVADKPVTLKAVPDSAIPPSDLVLKGEAPMVDHGGAMDDILDLVEIVNEPVVDLTPVPEEVMKPSTLDLSQEETMPAFEETVPMTVEAPAIDSFDSGNEILSGTTADAATAAMAKLLAGNVAVERELPGRVGNVTLEDMAKEIMKPLVKSWLDQNLPRVIEKMVAKEIEKLARRALDQ